MARSTFGGTAADFTFAATTGGYLKLEGATLTCWDAQAGGTQYVDLLVGGIAASSVTVGDGGQIPEFQGPDGVTALWVDGGAGRVLVTPSKPLDEANAHAQALVDGLPIVAQTGAYADLIGKPMIPASAADVGALPATTTPADLGAETPAGAQAKVQAAIDALLAGAPGALDTLNELATALNDDANFAATVTQQLVAKLDATAKGVAGGIAPLDDSGLLPDANVPARLSQATLSATFAGLGTPASIAALTAQGRAQADAASILRRWYVGLGNRGSRPTSVVILGDSITLGHGASTPGNTYRERLATALRARLGAPGGGRGYMSAVNTASSLSYAYPATLANGAAQVSTDYGLARTLVSLGVGNTITYQLHGTSADIVHLAGSGFGTFSYAVDGGAAVNVDTNNGGATTDGTTTRVSLGASGDHSLVITGVAYGSGLYVSGVIEYDGDESAGLLVHDGGHAGFTTTDWLANRSTVQSDPGGHWPGAVRGMNPDVILIALGENDSFATGMTPAQFRTNLAAVASDARLSLAKPVPVVFVPLYSPGGLDPAVWQQYVDATYDAAADDGNAVVADLSLRFNPYGVPSNDYFGIFYDTIHPNNAGHQIIADALTSFLLPG